MGRDLWLRYKIETSCVSCWKYTQWAKNQKKNQVYSIPPCFSWLVLSNSPFWKQTTALHSRFLLRWPRIPRGDISYWKVDESSNTRLVEPWKINLLGGVEDEAEAEETKSRLPWRASASSNVRNWSNRGGMVFVHVTTWSVHGPFDPGPFFQLSS